MNKLMVAITVAVGCRHFSFVLVFSLLWVAVFCGVVA